MLSESSETCFSSCISAWWNGFRPTLHETNRETLGWRKAAGVRSALFSAGGQPDRLTPFSICNRRILFDEHELASSNGR